MSNNIKSIESKNNSSFSVLASVYYKETANNLNRCFKSIWDEQLLKPNQIVLIEDGPLTKELYLTIAKWQSILGDVLKLIVNESNIGLTKSLNKGIKVIDTDYIARVDTDDVSTPNRFADQVVFLNENPDIAVVGGALQEYDIKHKNYYIRRYPLTHEEALATMYKLAPVAHPAAMIRTAIFKDAGLKYNEKYRYSQDMALWFDIVQAGFKIANLNEVVLLFECGEDVFRRRDKRRALCELKIFWKGVYRLYGPITYKYIYCIMRYLLRLMPEWVTAKAYSSNLRKSMISRK